MVLSKKFKSLNPWKLLCKLKISNYQYTAKIVWENKSRCIPSIIIIYHCYHCITLLLFFNNFCTLSVHYEKAHFLIRKKCPLWKIAYIRNKVMKSFLLVSLFLLVFYFSSSFFLSQNVFSRRIFENIVVIKIKWY